MTIEISGPVPSHSGRDLVLWAGRRYGGMTLKELGNCSGGIDYSAVAVSILRLVRKSGKDRALRKLMKYVAEQCQKVKMRPRSIVGFSIDEWRWVSRIE